MAVPTNKTELIIAIADNYEKLRAELLDIPGDRTKNKELEGHSKGTKMSACDLLAYLIGWGELVLKWNRRKERSEPVDFPETGFKWNELGKLAQKFYKDYENESLHALIKRLDKAVSEILELVRNKTNKQLYLVSWYDKWPLGRMIQLNTSSPYANARLRVRKWKKSKTSESKT